AADYSGSWSDLDIALLGHWRSHAVVKPLRVGGRMGEHKLELVLGLETVLELGNMFELEIGSELEVQLELAKAVSLAALAPIHLLVDPGVIELEIA
ncbi:MAG: hypothetical protein Q9175_006744, partial [Cornicularia normoerica]